MPSSQVINNPPMAIVSRTDAMTRSAWARKIVKKTSWRKSLSLPSLFVTKPS